MPRHRIGIASLETSLIASVMYGPFVLMLQSLRQPVAAHYTTGSARASNVNLWQESEPDMSSGSGLVGSRRAR